MDEPGVVPGELGAAGCVVGCVVGNADAVAECTPDLALLAADFAELTTRRVGARWVSVTVDRVRCRAVLAVVPAAGLADVLGAAFAEVRALVVADFDVVLGDVAEANVDSVSVADAEVDGVAVGHGGVVSLCNRCTIRYASDLLLAVMPDSTCERHAGLRSAIFSPVLRYTSENFSGPKDALTPW